MSKPWNRYKTQWLCLLVLVCAPAWADNEMKILLEILERKGILTDQEAEQVLREAQQAIATQDAEPPTSVVQPKPTEQLPPTSPTWQWSGDLRVRHETHQFDFAADPDKPDRHRQRLRARFGFKYDLRDHTQIGVALATGSSDAATSTNQTLDNGFSSKNLWLDKAYVRHTIGDNRAHIYLGKFDNLFNPYTALLFDGDLRFEGIATQINYAPLAITLGAFPLEESSSEPADPWVGMAQVVTKFERNNVYKLTAKLGYHHYSDIENTSVNNFTGNTQTEFELYNPTLTLDVYHLPIYFGAVLDYVHNKAVDERNDGWLIGAKFGHHKVQRFGSWQGFINYAELEADATYDEFSDADYHSGGTNHKTWVAGYTLGLGKGWNHAMKYYAGKQHEGPKQEDDRWQFDLKYKF